MNKKEVIKYVEDYINGKYNLGIIDDKIVKDCINKTLEAINYTHCCESDSELLVCDDNELDCPYEFTSRCTMGRCGCKPKAN